MFSILSIIVFASKIERTVKKSLLTSVRLLFGVWGSILNPQTLRELFLKVGGNFYITRGSLLEAKGSLSQPKGSLLDARGPLLEPKGSLLEVKEITF